MSKFFVFSTMGFRCAVLLFPGLLSAQSFSSFSSTPLSDDSLSSLSSSPSVDFTVRMGQGGFHDDRSPLGKLGGGQITLDMYPRGWPIGVSLFTEYYTNSNEPTHSYEIADLVALNLLYTRPLFGSNRIKYFFTGGAGYVKVPLGEDDPEEFVFTDVYNLEAGANVMAFWKIGFYGVVKYFTAHRSMDGVDVIDFDEVACLVGITFNFSL